jgi:hypothetical protein
MSYRTVGGSNLSIPKLAAAFVSLDVTMFHPARPPVRESTVENNRASK